MLGHPLADSYGAALAEAYCHGAQAVGTRLEILRLADVMFDLRRHPHQLPADGLEPDLREAQALLGAASHWVLVFPVWSGTYPALMKAFFDCALSEGFAFERDTASMRLRPLLQGKTARLITTMNTPPWLYQWALGDCGITALRRCTLGVCGVATRPITRIGPIRRMTPETRQQWLQRVSAMGQHDAVRLRP